MYRSSRGGCRPACCQARATIVCCTPSFRPSDRVDHWVAPCGGGRRVQVMMRAAKAGVSTVGFEPRCRAANPDRPSCTNRCFHNAIVRELQPVIVAIVA